MPADANSPLQRLSALGQSVWVDFLSRESIHGGHLQSLIDESAVVGATSNPTILQKAMRLHETLDRPNLLVKIPATKPGLGAIEDVVAKGRSINVTLIFSLTRYAEVAESYVRGIERLVAEGGDPRKVASVASFFVSRIDTEADRRLEEVGGHDDLKGKLAIANARLAYRHYLEVFSGPRWEFLAGKGATPQRVLWASTSTKNPAYPDTLYVEELLGPDTVDTMPEETIVAYQDHGRPEPRLLGGIEEAERVFAELERAGVDYDDVTDTLEREGVEKFAESFDELMQALSAKRETLAPA
jgi:transaldolase